MSAWQPIETAPKDGEWFLAYWPECAPEDRYLATKWCVSDIDGDCWLDHAEQAYDDTQPTHWMPLPEAPQ